jgi:hypothetical protein
MTKKKPRYESRVFDGRIIHSAEIERIHKEVLDFKHIEAISEPMRELIEDLWPELANKLPPKANWIMALTMRPTGLGSGAYQDNIDYNIFSGEWLIGGIYERKRLPGWSPLILAVA